MREREVFPGLKTAKTLLRDERSRRRRRVLACECVEARVLACECGAPHAIISTSRQCCERRAPPSQCALRPCGTEWEFPRCLAQDTAPKAWRFLSDSLRSCW